MVLDAKLCSDTMLHVGSFINCLNGYISLSETDEQHDSSVTQNENSVTQNENSVTQNENSEKISINKSTFNKIIIGAVIAIAAATFAGGFILGSSSSVANPDDLVKSDLADQLAALEKKLDNVQAPTPTVQPSPSVQPAQQAPAPKFQVSIDDDPIKGDPDAPVTIIEFSDFQCPFCKRWYSDTLSQITEDFIDTGIAKLVYRDHPLDGLHPNAREVHIASECADEQDKFWGYHDILFEDQSGWNRLPQVDLSSKLIEYATTLELDTASFESCLSSQEIADEVSADVLDAVAVGATGTTTFLVGNEKDGYIKLVGAQPYSSFKYAIDNLLR